MFRAKFIVLAAALVFGGLGFQATSAEGEVILSFDHFYDHTELTRSLRALEQAYPQFVTLQSIGKSFQGRDLWAVILNNPKTGPAERKPGYYIDGNIHGNEIQGTEVALYAVYYLLKNYGQTEFATRLLDDRAFYVVPTMNPDSRDYFLHEAAHSSMPRGGFRPFDEDRDGIADEDGPDDLDGDGSITMMRKKDPAGPFKANPDDPRIVVPIKPGEKGEYALLGEEGIDNDGDGLVNEDGPSGYDMNRNFGYNWQPAYVQQGAGEYPFCFPETKAVADFIVSHPNIAGVQSFHNFGGMILRGPGAKNMGEYNPMDRRVYDFIAKNGEKILPGYRYMTVYKDMYTVYGGTIDFTYATLGIFTFSNELDIDPSTTVASSGGGSRRGGSEEEGEEDPMSRVFGAEENMKFFDWVLMGEQYTEWKPFKHPLYGDIEIGGVKKFGRRVPPSFRLAETCHRNAAFCLYHADQLPRLSFERVKVTALGGDVYELDLALANSRATPSISAVASQRKLHRPDRLKLDGPGTEILAAGLRIDEFRNITSKMEHRKSFVWVENGIPGFGRLELRLIIKAKAGARLVYDSLKGGTVENALKLE